MSADSSPLIGLPAPIDVGGFVYLILLYEGVGNLFPWNAFITASSYYAERFCGTAFEETFENYFSITYTLSQTIGLVFTVLYQDKLTMNQKITIPLLCYTVIFALTTMLVGIQEIDPTLLFFVTLLSAFASGSVGALLSGGLFSLGAMLPAAYTGVLMNGQGLAGLVVSLSALLTSLASAAESDCDDDAAKDDDGGCANTLNYSALAYFLIATLVLLTCVVAFTVVKRLPFTRYYYARAMGADEEGEKNPLFDSSLSTPILPPSSFSSSPPTSTSSALPPFRITMRESEDFSSPPSRATTGGEGEGAGEKGERLIKQSSDGGANGEGEGVWKERLSHSSNNPLLALSLTSIMKVYRKISPPALSVMLTFTVTISVFPSLTVLLESVQKCHSSERFYNDLFTPFLFLLYNLSDFGGRVLAGLGGGRWVTPLNIVYFSLGRVVFIPLLLFCKVSNSQLPTLFVSDFFPCFFLISLALSNGYLASLAMMYGPDLVDKEETGLAGTIMVLCLTVGLLLGACCSFIVVLISQGSL